MTTTAPQDHKPKADAPFTFKAPGVDKNGKAIQKSYTLPKATEDIAERLDGGITMDAVLHPDDDTAQLRLSFAMLEAAQPSPEALKAIRSLSTPEMLKVVNAWMGESSGSSD